MSANVTLIPGIMDAKGWRTGATLMRRWLGGPPAAKPTWAPADTHTVKMKWVLRYPRAKAVYDGMMADRIWANPAARALIADRLRSGALRPGQVRAASGQPVQVVGRYVNSRTAGKQSDPLDGLSAALGRFNFHLVFDGHIERDPPPGLKLPAPVPGVSRLAVPLSGPFSYTVTVAAVGVYVYDSYDFNDDPAAFSRPGTWVSQPLGCWNPETNAAARSWVGAGWQGFCVNNRTFRDWRAANKAGGDFEVFSDMKRTPLRPPQSFQVSP